MPATSLASRPLPDPPAPPGFFASVCSLPFDFIKTRLQKMTPNPDGTMPYKGPIDCAMQTLRNEGPLTFYTGFPTFLFRCGPACGPAMDGRARGRGRGSHAKGCLGSAARPPDSWQHHRSLPSPQLTRSTPEHPPLPPPASRRTSCSRLSSWTPCPSLKPSILTCNVCPSLACQHSDYLIGACSFRATTLDCCRRQAAILPLLPLRFWPAHVRIVSCMAPLSIGWTHTCISQLPSGAENQR